MITPSIRQNLQLLQGTPMEDGSPSWLLYDNLRNKYFTLGVNAFRMLKHWISGVDTKQFIEQVQQKGLDIEEDHITVQKIYKFCYINTIHKKNIGL